MAQFDCKFIVFPNDGVIGTYAREEHRTIEAASKSSAYTKAKKMIAGGLVAPPPASVHLLLKNIRPL